MSHVLLELAFEVVKPSIAGWRTLSIGNVSALTVPHVISPVSNIPQLLFVKVITKAMPLIILPVTNVKLFIIVEAFALLSISGILFPIAMVLVAWRLFTIAASVRSEPISLLHWVDIAFVGVSISILDANNVSTWLMFWVLYPWRVFLWADPTQIRLIDYAGLIVASSIPTSIFEIRNFIPMLHAFWLYHRTIH